MENNNVKTLEYSFRSTYESVPRNLISKIKRELMGIFNVSSNEAFYNRLHGRVEPRIKDFNAVESLFKSYGITVEWGKEPETFINEPAESN